MRTPLLLAVLGLAATATAQMPLPPFGNTFSATLTRGFWFQAPVDFAIVGLQVPNESGLPNQVVEVIDLGGPPAVWPATAAGTQLFYDNATPTGSIIPCYIPITNGTYVGILGVCNPAQGSPTSANSYSLGNGPFPSDVLGFPVQLTRLGTQSGIASNGGNQACWTEPNFQISRVEVYVAPVGSGTFATNTSVGDGCIDEFASFYENFATSAAFDLNNTAWTCTNVGTGYVVLPGGVYNPVGSLATPTVVPLTDDSQAAVGTLGLTVGSNGWVAFGAGNSNAFGPAVPTFLGNPATAFYTWHDLNPAASGSGQVQYEELGPLAQITFDGVYDFGGTSAASANFLQYQVNTATGDVTIAIGTTSGQGNGWLVGYSPGGANLDPGATDISAQSLIQTFANDIVPLSLAANSRPVLGTNWNLTVGNVPASTAFGMVIYGTADPAILDLGFLGLPSCQLRATLDLLVGPWLPTGATYAYSFPVPATPTSLVGFDLFTQAVTFGTPANSFLGFGAVTSNAIRGTVGDL